MTLVSHSQPFIVTAEKGGVARQVGPVVARAVTANPRNESSKHAKHCELLGQPKGWCVKPLEVKQDAWSEIRRHHDRRLLDGQDELLCAYYSGLYGEGQNQIQCHLGQDIYG